MVSTQVSAQELFQSAYENRYTWDRSFPGYTADVTFRHDDRTVQGHIQVSSELKPTVSDVADEESQKAIHNQLFEVAIHRIRRTFADVHSKNTFSYGDTDETGAVEIIVGGKGEGDSYRLRNNEVSMVHRHIHGVVVTIYTSSSHDTGEGYLSHRYDSVYHDPKTGEQKGGKSVYEDEYEKVGDFFLLNRRLIQTETPDGTQEMEFKFSNFKLLVAN
ncbi:MAG: DUF3386 domain-containing protein [Cyanobacteria bacterium P01_H01_bin.121]